MRSDGPAEDLRAAGAWLGASWLVRLRDEGFVFAVENRSGVAEISAIGGKVEPGETFREAARREYAEETGTRPPELVDVSTPALFGIETAAHPEVEGACAFVRKAATTPEGHANDLWIAVFLGVTAEDPQPVEKLPAFVVVPHERFGLLTQEGLGCGRVIGDASSSATGGHVLRDTVAALATRPDTVSRMWHLTSQRATSAVTGPG